MTSHNEAKAGLIVGYQITEERFRPILSQVSKQGTGWKYPVFLQALLEDPSPLFLCDRWLYDPEALERAGFALKNKGVDSSLLTQLFNNSTKFEAIDVQGMIDSDGITIALETIASVKSSRRFREQTKNLVRVYGDYATPTAHDFEAMNAGIVRAIKTRHNLVILDDVLRGPLYDQAGLLLTEKRSLAQKSLLRRSSAYVVPLPGVRKWSPHELDEMLLSEEAIGLRETINTMVHAKATDASAYFQEALQNIERISKADVAWAFVAAGAAVTSPAFLPIGAAFFVSTLAGAAAIRQFYRIGSNYRRNGRLRWPQLARKLRQIQEKYGRGGQSPS